MKNIIWICLFLLNIHLAAKAQFSLTVAQDGSGDFVHIQDAINALPDDNGEKIIVIKEGVYEEKIFIDKNNVKLIGEKKPVKGKAWEELSKTLSKNPRGVFIIASISRDIWRCKNPDDWGAAPVNIRANDIYLKNLSVVNTYGFNLKEEFEIDCRGEKKLIRKDGHQFALRTLPPTQRLTVEHCNFYSLGGDTVSPWDVENGTYYFNDCTMEGGVDFYCPRGWAYAEDCYFICHNDNAGIWHDSRVYQDSKSVIKNSVFKGKKDFKLGRYHKDAAIYLINCRFPDEMADFPVYQVAGNEAKWGERIYYYQSKKEGKPYPWLNDNIEKKDAKVLTRDNVLNERWLHPVPYSKPFDYPVAGQRVVEKIYGRDPKAENMVLAQRNCGGWAKTLDGITQPPPYDQVWNEEMIAQIKIDKEQLDCTIDNGATAREILYLLEAYDKFKNPEYLVSAENGIRYLLEMQYENGGFPQFYPKNDGYPGHITYNDDAMINALEVLRSAGLGKGVFSVIEESIRKQAGSAVEKGIECVLKTQILKDGKRTVWTAQYDKTTLIPAKARTYEHPSYAIRESATIIEFLMGIEQPDDEIKQSIREAVQFLHDLKITGIKYEKQWVKIDGKFSDITITTDPDAKPVWARFYELDSLRPIFSGRDGVIKYNVFEIEEERRRGYGWYGFWPEDLLEKKYPRWYQKHFETIHSGLTYTRDTSYNLNSAYKSTLKNYPDISLPVCDQQNMVYLKDLPFGTSGLKIDVCFKEDNREKIPVLNIHGGGWRSGDKSMMKDMAQALASKGYICFIPEYTLSTHGLYPAPIKDLREALVFIEGNTQKYQLRMDALTVAGHSAGGQLAALLATTQDKNKFNGTNINVERVPTIRILIDIDGVLAFNHPDSREGNDKTRPSASTLWFGGSKTDRYDLFIEASALTHVSQLTPPTLFIASKEVRMRAGWNAFAQKLMSFGIKSAYKEFENAPHNLIYFEPWFTPMIDRMDSFIQEVTQNKQ